MGTVYITVKEVTVAYRTYFIETPIGELAEALENWEELREETEDSQEFNLRDAINPERHEYITDIKISED